ncbi:hypothetical protein JIG36_28385 [Actinoplanes sp. LDG1-06]|uniref:Trypsin-co-occurring domain-containing protein n=1 Tax=Paractinoplanes ovalisporus TaxID=2810368 RepID=A0ABS2AJD3_9ACTN|nr:trypco2 family protein [Actinoplanes ovalisporus]MBM2619478.1 hypothetical protein [Actinoplanes ovalisporus]
MRATDDAVHIADLINTVKDAVREANVSVMNPDRDLRVSKVDLTLSVVANYGRGAGIELKVPVIGSKLGGKYRRGSSSTQTVQVTLVPPPPSDLEVRSGGVTETLVGAIETVRAAIAAGAGGDDPFELESSVVTLIFAVSDTGSITLLGEGDLEDTATNTLVLTLVRSKD